MKAEVTDEMKKKNADDKKKKEFNKARGPFDKRLKMEDPVEKR